MHRIFIPKNSISGDRIAVTDKGEIHHLRDVLRVRCNEAVVVFDEEGTEYSCLVESIGRTVSLGIRSRKHYGRLSCQGQLTVACAIPRQSRMDDIVDKLTQLGVDRIIPLVTSRVMVRLDAQKRLERQERWKKVAIAAAKQSQRRNLPDVWMPVSLEELLKVSKEYGLRLIATLGVSCCRPLRDVLEQSGNKSILVLIGPEGDFTQGEIREAKKAGCIPVSLGATTLRVDTAAIAVSAFINFFSVQ